MNTTQNTSPQAATSRFGSLRNLGRSIVVSSAVALLGVSTMSAADASAAGVATGIRYAGNAAEVVKPAPTRSAHARAARPKGPSVATCTASGRNASAIRAKRRPGSTATRMPG